MGKTNYPLTNFSGMESERVTRMKPSRSKAGKNCIKTSFKRRLHNQLHSKMLASCQFGKPVLLDSDFSSKVWNGFVVIVSGTDSLKNHTVGNQYVQPDVWKH
eukprot:634978-Amphidinium_carterae.1